MKRAKLLTLGILMLGVTSLTSCKKEGCTDNDSLNYSAEAKKDDGSCKYEGNAVIWYGEDAALGLMMDGATNLTFYVDGKVVGSTATNIYWTESPACGENASITITKDLGDVKTQAYTYSVRDQTGHEYWNGVLNFNANTCFTTELIW